jgi:preprotein translocase subunit SecA
MISNSIERAQRKVEENHFGVRKRLLEYDDVMNKQRTVVYEKRRHALMGERIGMDIANTIWDRVVAIIERNDYTGCKEEFIRLFGMEVPFTEEQFLDTRHRDEMAEQTFQTALAHFNHRTERICEVAQPVIKQVFENQGSLYERILVPITDGRRIYNISCNLREAYETECKSVVKEFEKQMLLHIIDEAWKENLRELDELRHSVQNASYEQKDPLLIFKLESVKLFDNMVNEMNNRSVTILTRAQIPELQNQQVQQASEEHTDRRQYTENRQQGSSQEEQLVDQNQKAAAQHDTRAQQPRNPIIKDKLPGRNDPCPCGSGKKFKNCHGKGIV